MRIIIDIPEFGKRNGWGETYPYRRRIYDPCAGCLVKNDPFWDEVCHCSKPSMITDSTNDFHKWTTGAGGGEYTS